MDARQTIIDRIHAFLSELGGVAAYLYGSFARRSAGSESDVDILVVHPDDISHDAIVDVAFDLSEAIRTWAGNTGQVYSVTRSELRDSLARAEPVVMSIRREAVTVLGPTFDRLLLELEADETACA
ncbi:nucleotidyltransferase domain-containing protein [Herbiconiux sp. KACC 21604]|uniref:nucleotidyltransferase family protein n=1 Tax=unclassified Herbiconiux TaxID=2618217 RepID=UPI00149196FB|nr:nucleotidyltransferase domain-containing protein [Herbiconiux sp. SALV-R1]QJU52684.1 nucleotidyltransferase domain-containing protein [Herbiconiux sp. SALV-R1]WPO87582.1 nucleotidyltransferase domain-containing protein [Herbiconiux sp. KACC 21604]